MLKKVVFFAKFFFFITFLIASIYYDENVSIGVGKISFSLHASVLVLLIWLLYLIYATVKDFFNSIGSWFHKSKQEKGLQDLQVAFSRMLLKDKSPEILKYLQKSKKYLGDLPIISWLEGQFYLMHEDEHQAKAEFYSLVAREKGTSFGSLGLYKIASAVNSSKEALEAIENLTKYCDSPSLGFTAVALAFKSHDFERAKKYLQNLKNTNKFQLIQAIIWSEEGFYTNNIDLLKKAFKLKPELLENTLRYADSLMKKGKIRKAQNILEDTFVQVQYLKIFEKFTECEEDKFSSRAIKNAEKLVQLAPNSWVGYFGFGKLALAAEIYTVAFENFYHAYQIKHYDFIANKLLESAKMLNDPKPQEAVDVLTNPLISEYTNFVWRCDHCYFSDDIWHPICPRCSWIGEFNYGNLMEKVSDLPKNSFSDAQLPDYSIFME